MENDSDSKLHDGHLEFPVGSYLWVVLHIRFMSFTLRDRRRSFAEHCELRKARWSDHCCPGIGCLSPHSFFWVWFLCLSGRTSYSEPVRVTTETGLSPAPSSVQDTLHPNRVLALFPRFQQHGQNYIYQGPSSLQQDQTRQARKLFL